MKSIRFVLITALVLILPHFLFAKPVVTEGLLKEILFSEKNIDIKIVIKHPKDNKEIGDWRLSFINRNKYLQDVMWFPHSSFFKGRYSRDLSGIGTPLSSNSHIFAAGKATVAKTKIINLINQNEIVWIGLPEDDHMAVKLPVYYPSTEQLITDNSDLFEFGDSYGILSENTTKDKYIRQEALPLFYSEDTRLTGRPLGTWMMAPMIRNGDMWSAVTYFISSSKKGMSHSHSKIKHYENGQLVRNYPELTNLTAPSFEDDNINQESLDSLKDFVIKNIVSAFKEGKVVNKDTFTSSLNKIVQLRNLSEYTGDSSSLMKNYLWNLDDIKAVSLHYDSEKAYFIVSVPSVQWVDGFYKSYSFTFLVGVNKPKSSKEWSVVSIRPDTYTSCLENLVAQSDVFRFLF